LDPAAPHFGQIHSARSLVDLSFLITTFFHSHPLRPSASLLQRFHDAVRQHTCGQERAGHRMQFINFPGKKASEIARLKPELA
jgi:hypothetical protein